jgi:hypothetical protein
LAASLFLLNVVAGCDIESTSRTGGPVGNEAQQATDLAGGLDSPAPAANPNPAPNPQPMPNPQPAAQAAPEPVGQQSDKRIGTRTNEILNAKELANNPEWTLAAADPTQVKANTTIGTVYGRAVGLAGSVGLEQWVQHTKALEDRFPTYAELQDYASKNGVDLPTIPQPYRHYAYDEATGQIVLYDNVAEKEGRLRELHLDESK